MTASLRTLTIALDTALDTTAWADVFPATPAELLRQDTFCWLRRGEGLLGFGEIAAFSGTGPERFADAERWWKALLASASTVDSLRIPGTGPLAFGSFAFSKTSSHPSVLVIPALVVGFRDNTTWITQLTVDGTEPTLESAMTLLRGFLASPNQTSSTSSPSTTPSSASANTASSGVLTSGALGPGALTEEQWKAGVSAGVQAIEAGGLEKVVLARDVVATFSEPVERVSVLQQLVVHYGECWTYGVRGLVGATPEMLIQVEGSTARARVLAGTLDREDEPIGSQGFAERVLGGSTKQRQEHDFAVRSLTRQLAPFATDLSVPAEPFILELPNVWHLASDVSAELADSEGHLPTSLALVEALHPTAAVCGTPRDDAGKLILELEKMDRGPYAGPVGWLDGAGNGEWGIALRGAVLETPTTARLYAGAGIVAASVPEAELAETWAKLRPMIQALGLHR